MYYEKPEYHDYHGFSQLYVICGANIDQVLEGIVYERRKEEQIRNECELQWANEPTASNVYHASKATDGRASHDIYHAAKTAHG